jgi:hypothetical protein
MHAPPPHACSLLPVVLLMRMLVLLMHATPTHMPLPLMMLSCMLLLIMHAHCALLMHASLLSCKLPLMMLLLMHAPYS